MGVVRRVLGSRLGGRQRRDGRSSNAVDGLVDLLGEAVISEVDGRLMFGRDGGMRAGEPPLAVVMPGDEGELIAAMRYCHAQGLDIVPRGGATSLRGGALGSGRSVVIATTRLNRIIALDRRERLVTAQAGATLTALGREANGVGLRLAMAPFGASPATLGGAIAKNVQGRAGAASGPISRCIEGLRLVGANGEMIETGAEGEGCGGYDLTGVIAGSEGALGIVSAATLRLEPAAAAFRLIVARFGDEDQALAAAGQVVGRGGATTVVAVAGGGLLDGQSAGLGAWDGAHDDTFVLVEIEGFDETVRAVTAAITEVLGESGAGTIEETADAAVRRRFWAVLESGPARLAQGRHVGISDIVVPVGRLADVARQMREIAGRHDANCVALIKPLAGAVQSLFMAGDQSDESARQVEGAIHEAVALAGSVGGLATGEFGAGAIKVAQAGYGGLEPSAFGMQHLVKAVFDGDGVMNPGKVLVPVEPG